MAWGELLIDLASPRVFRGVVFSAGSEDKHAYAIPDLPVLIGQPVSTQGFLFDGRVHATNAFDLVFGR